MANRTNMLVYFQPTCWPTMLARFVEALTRHEYHGVNHGVDFRDFGLKLGLYFQDFSIFSDIG